MKVSTFHAQDYTVFGCNPHRGASPAKIIEKTQRLLGKNLIGEYPNSSRTSDIIRVIFVETHGKPSDKNLKQEFQASIHDPEWFLPDACEVASFIALNLAGFPSDFPEHLICGFNQGDTKVLTLKRSGWDAQARFILEEESAASVTDSYFIMLASDTYNPE